MDALGDDHVGFAAKYLPEKTLAVVGARPFSRGGARWADERAFYQRQYGIADYSQSAKRIADTVLAQVSARPVLLFSR